MSKEFANGAVLAVYHHGALHLSESVDWLDEGQTVEIYIAPARPHGDSEWQPPPWWDEWLAELAAMTPWERAGRWPDELTPQQIQSRVEAVQRNYGLVELDDPELALEVATSDELSEWNLDL
ncbi:MAG: hypothetical protein ACETWR_22515 [Anaerolineae bacterium]